MDETSDAEGGETGKPPSESARGLPDPRPERPAPAR